MQIDAIDHAPYLRAAQFGYENIEGLCGMCGTRIVINRATDLGGASWVFAMTHFCSACGELIEIPEEPNNHPVDLFWMQESHALLLQKRYMQAVLVLGQALELALALCARHVLIDQPLDRDSEAPREEMQALWMKFEKKILSLTLGSLCQLVAHLAIIGDWPDSVHAADASIDLVARSKGKTPEPSDVASIADEPLRHAIDRLLNSSIVDLRNAVAHELRRPTQAEAEKMRDDVGGVVRLAMTAFGVPDAAGREPSLAG
jgi:hypothetical protein